MNIYSLRLFLLFGTGFGCAGLTAEGAKVIAVNDTSGMNGCEHLDRVSASSGWGGIASTVGHRQALEDIRNETAEKGGTHVVITASSTGWGGGHAEGEAYRCPPGYSPGQRDGCAKDTDCKGNRVCENERCVETTSQ